MKTEIEQLQETIDALRESNLELQENNADLENEVEALRVDLRNVEKKLEDANREIKNLPESIDSVIDNAKSPYGKDHVETLKVCALRPESLEQEMKNTILGNLNANLTLSELEALQKQGENLAVQRGAKYITF